MKKLYILLAALALLLCACTPVTQQPGTNAPDETTVPDDTTLPDDTTVPNESTAPPETTAPVETTEQNETFWTADINLLPSGADYLSQAHTYTSIPPMQWLGRDNNTYSISKNATGMTVVDATGQSVCEIPLSSDLLDYQIIGADGIHVFLYQNFDFIRLNLATGIAERSVSSDILVVDVQVLDSNVYFYATYEPNECEVRIFCRFNDTLQVVPFVTYGSKSSSLFWLERPECFQGQITWTQINPDMLTKLQEELSNPDSIYKVSASADYSAIWGCTDIITDFSQQDILKDLCRRIQEDTGIYALEYVTYDLSTESYVSSTPAPVETIPFTETEEYIGWKAYMKTSDYWRVFTFSGELGDYPGELTIDTSAMEVDLLYFIDFETGKIVQITDSPVLTSPVRTSEHIYYVLESQPTKVWRCDYDGDNHTIVYESDYGAVTYLRYYGTDANGKLILCEEQNRIISYDLATENLELLMEAFFIEQFFYSPTSLSWDYLIKNVSKGDMGPTIFWTGVLHEDDPKKPYDYSYYYIIQTNRQFDVTSG